MTLTADLPLLLTGKQAAVYLGVGRVKLRRLTRAGVIPCWEDPDTGWRHYSRLALDEWARRNGQQGDAA